MLDKLDHLFLFLLSHIDMLVADAAVYLFELGYEWHAAVDIMFLVEFLYLEVQLL